MNFNGQRQKLSESYIVRKLIVMNILNYKSKYDIFN